MALPSTDDQRGRPHEKRRAHDELSVAPPRCWAALGLLASACAAYLALTWPQYITEQKLVLAVLQALLFLLTWLAKVVRARGPIVVIIAAFLILAGLLLFLSWLRAAPLFEYAGAYIQVRAQQRNKPDEHWPKSTFPMQVPVLTFYTIYTSELPGTKMNNKNGSTNAYRASARASSRSVAPTHHRRPYMCTRPRLANNLPRTTAGRSASRCIPQKTARTARGGTVSGSEERPRA